MAEFALDGVVYVSCARTSTLQPGVAKEHYRVTLQLSVGGILMQTTFSEVVQDMAANLLQASGYAVAPLDVPSNIPLSDNLGWTSTLTFDVFTLGAARLRTVGDLGAIIEAISHVRVVRIERLAADAVTGEDRHIAIGDVNDAEESKSESNGTVAQLKSLAAKVGLGLGAVLIITFVILAIYYIPRRRSNEK